MEIKEIRSTRGNLQLVLEKDRQALVPLLRQTALTRISVGNRPIGVAFDGAFIWVVNEFSFNVSKINVTTNAVVATVGVGSAPTGVAFDGTDMWVANFNSNNVSKIPALNLQ